MTQSVDRLDIIAPDDWHIHLRDGDALDLTVPHAAESFKRAIVMPNLVPPVTNAEQALAYKRRIQARIPTGVDFEPLMVLYLTDKTSPKDIAEAAKGKARTISPRPLPRITCNITATICWLAAFDRTTTACRY